MLCSQITAVKHFIHDGNCIYNIFLPYSEGFHIFSHVTKQTWVARSYKSCLHSTTQPRASRTKSDCWNQDVQITSGAKIKAEFICGGLRSLLVLQQSRTRNLSSFQSTPQVALSGCMICKPRQGFIVREHKQIAGSAADLSQLGAYNFN